MTLGIMSPLSIENPEALEPFGPQPVQQRGWFIATSIARTASVDRLPDAVDQSPTERERVPVKGGGGRER